MEAAPLVNGHDLLSQGRRAFRFGEPFADVDAEFASEDDGVVHPVFSEAHLYPLLGKDDARFVLSVAGEYAKLITVLGVDEVKRLLS